MNNKRNAFTLIELLAIIVILAIIAVITIPILLNVIENSRKGAATDSAYGFKDSINKYYITKLSDDRQFQLEGEYTVTNGYLSGPKITEENGVQIPVSGTIPSSGSLTYSNNTLTEGCLVMGEYAVSFNNDGTTSTKKGDCPPLYGYSISANGYNSSDSNTISTTRPTNMKNYLRYSLVNGEVAPGTVPETCIYIEAGEFCIKNNEFETSVQNIKDYFEYTTTGENAWTSPSTNTWMNQTQTKTCTITSGTWGGFSCENTSENVSIFASPNGRVYSMGPNSFVCEVLNNSNAQCLDVSGM